MHRIGKLCTGNYHYNHNGTEEMLAVSWPYGVVK